MPIELSDYVEQLESVLFVLLNKNKILLLSILPTYTFHFIHCWRDRISHKETLDKVPV